jgi:ZIP family zinc transporter
MVFFLKKNIKLSFKKMLLGFASGVMIAASIWSLLIPSIKMAEEQCKIPWLPASLGFIFGILFLLILDSIIPHLHLDKDKPEGIKKSFKKDYHVNFSSSAT